MLDSGAHEITDDLLLAAATATADTVASEQLNANYIVPSVFYSAVAPRGRRRHSKRSRRIHQPGARQRRNPGTPGPRSTTPRTTMTYESSSRPVAKSSPTNANEQYKTIAVVPVTNVTVERLAQGR